MHHCATTVIRSGYLPYGEGSTSRHYRRTEAYKVFSAVHRFQHHWSHTLSDVPPGVRVLVSPSTWFQTILHPHPYKRPATLLARDVQSYGATFVPWSSREGPSARRGHGSKTSRQHETMHKKGTPSFMYNSSDVKAGDCFVRTTTAVISYFILHNYYCSSQSVVIRYLAHKSRGKRCQLAVRTSAMARSILEALLCVELKVGTPKQTDTVVWSHVVALGVLVLRRTHARF